MKIDTDGYDLKVLCGADAFIAAERPVIFGEFSAHCLAWHGQSLDDVRAWAAGHGYEMWLRSSRTGFRFSPAALPGYSMDLLLVPSEKADALGWCRVD